MPSQGNVHWWGHLVLTTQVKEEEKPKMQNLKFALFMSLARCSFLTMIGIIIGFRLSLSSWLWETPCRQVSKTWPNHRRISIFLSIKARTVPFTKQSADSQWERRGCSCWTTKALSPGSRRLPEAKVNLYSPTRPTLPYLIRIRKLNERLWRGGNSTYMNAVENENRCGGRV